MSRVWRHGREPGECSTTGFDAAWEMPARGHLDDDQFAFDAQDVELLWQRCPGPLPHYGADHFEGLLDWAHDVLQLTSDGGVDPDQPFTFWRIRCDLDPDLDP